MIKLSKQLPLCRHCCDWEKCGGIMYDKCESIHDNDEFVKDMVNDGCYMSVDDFWEHNS